MKFLRDMRPKEAEEAFRKTDTAVIPEGAIHAHGAGVPMGMDIIMAEELADRISKRTNVIVLPLIAYGYTQYHGDFPGVISISRPTYRNMLFEICEWLHKWGIQKIVYILGHGGDEPMLQEAAYYCRYKWNILSASIGWGIAEQLIPEVKRYSDPAAGEGLTEDLSLMLYLRPNLVDVSEETFKKRKQVLGDKFEVEGLTNVRFKQGTVRIYLRNKDITDTTGYGPNIDKVNYISESSAKLGERILTAAVDYIVDFIEEFRKIKNPPL